MESFPFSRNFDCGRRMRGPLDAIQRVADVSFALSVAQLVANRSILEPEPSSLGFISSVRTEADRATSAARHVCDVPNALSIGGHEIE